MKLHKIDFNLLALLALWGVLLIAVAIASPFFFQSATATTIMQFSTILILVSIGQALVVLAGGAGIDLSVGGSVSLNCVVTMLLVSAGLPGFAILPCVLILGALLGLFNGVIVTKVGILPLIVTLGTFYLYSGLALAVSGGAPISGVPDWLVAWGRGDLLGVPYAFLTVVVPIFLIAFLVAEHSSWGRWIYSMGCNEASARLSGIPVDRVRIILYSISGACCGLAAFVSLGWLGSARPNMGLNLEIETLAVVLLAGFSIFGGTGKIVSVFVAALLLISLKTGLQFNNISSVWQIGSVGFLILIALLSQRFWQRG